MAMLRCIMLAAAALTGVAHADHPLAVVSIVSPKDLAGHHPGHLVPGWPAPDASLELATFDAPGDGCAPYSMEARPLGGFVAIVRAGNCSLRQKALNAQEAGAKGLVVARAREAHVILDNSTLDVENASVFIIWVQESLADDVLAWNAAHSQDDAVRASFKVYQPQGLLDPSLLVLLVMATGLVVAGAFFATADLRLNSPLAPKSDEVFELGKWFPLVWCVGGSTVLVILYFLMEYLIYAVIFVFCFGGTFQLTEIGHKLLRYYLPALKKKLCTPPLLGTIEVSNLVAFPCATALVVFWLFHRNTEYAWLPQDIIAAGFLCFLQRTMRLTNIKVAATLLVALFVFDIFWVFISPLFFEQSVMMAVATGGGTGENVPMLLVVPAIGDPLGGKRMLGFGDIVLPGLLISFLRRFDLLSRRSLLRGYFLPAVVGYAVAMCAAFVGLFLMQTGQPALLYLVPATLGTTLVLGCMRGELKALWHGTVLCGAALHGTTPRHCPGGHELQPWTAEAPGRCDGCRQAVPVGEQVMDCRECDWFVCGRCRGPAAADPKVGLEVGNEDETNVSTVQSA